MQTYILYLGGHVKKRIIRRFYPQTYIFLKSNQ